MAGNVLIHAFRREGTMTLRAHVHWKMPKTAVFAAGLLGVLGLGVVDFATGYEISMFVFYGIPIIIVAWYADNKSALLLALLAGIVWWWADQLAMHRYRWGLLEAWETAVRLAFFIFAALSGAAIKGHHNAANSRIRLLEYSNQLEQEIVNISEQEQRRIGQDLHDGICQYLAALGYSASSLQKDLQNAGLPALASTAQELAERIKESVSQTRDLARGLVPVQMDEAGLVSALEELTFSASRLLGINVTLRCEGDIRVSDYATSTHLFRIAQEALNNAVKHGKAKRVDVTLKQANNCIRLTIRDDGIGIQAVASSSNGVGLKIMGYRSRCIAGELQIMSALARGTLIDCLVRQETCSESSHVAAT